MIFHVSYRRKAYVHLMQSSLMRRCRSVALAQRVGVFPVTHGHWMASGVVLVPEFEGWLKLVDHCLHYFTLLVCRMDHYLPEVKQIVGLNDELDRCSPGGRTNVQLVQHVRIG